MAQRSDSPVEQNPSKKPTSGTDSPPFTKNDEVVAAGDNAMSLSAIDNNFEGQEEQVFREDQRERICPVELRGAKREAYMGELWNQFGAKAIRGTINLGDVEDIAYALQVDGALNPGALEALVPVEKQSALGFDDVVELFDRASKSAAQDFGDIDVDHSKAAADEVLLDPFTYAWMLLPCSSKEAGMKYRVDPNWKFELRPKVSLLLTTTSMILVIGVAVIVLISLLWQSDRMNNERKTVRNLKDTFRQLAVLYERTHTREYQGELQIETELIANMADDLQSQEAQAQLTRQERWSHQIAMAELYPSKSFTETADDVLQELVDAGTVFRPSLSSFLVSDGKHSVRPLANLSLPCSGTVVPIADSSAAGLCVTSTGNDDSAERRATVARVVQELQAEAFIRPTIIAFHQDSATVPKGQFLTTEGQNNCFDLDNEALCAPTVSLVMSSTQGTTTGFNNKSMMWGGYRSRTNNVTVLIVRPTDVYKEKRQNEFINMLNYFNSINNITEMGAGRIDRITGQFDYHLTNFRFQDQCFEKCERTGPALKNIKNAVEFQASWMGVTPDYRPFPCASSASWLPILGISLLLEKDLEAVRTSGLGEMTKIVDEMNAKMAGSTEIEIFHFLGMPPMKTFDPDVPCSATEDCLETTKFGVYFRYDCVHCTPVKAWPSGTPIEFLTIRKKGRIERTDPDPLYERTLRTKTELEATIKDYAGDSVLLVTSFVANYSIGLSVKCDEKEMTSAVMDSIYVAIGVAIAIFVGGLLLLFLLSNNALSKIEGDWVESKEKIAAEKKKFGELVADLVPPHFSERMMKGVPLISEAALAGCVVFGDMCGFSEYTKGMIPKHIIRVANYCFSVLENVAQLHKLSRLAAIGDTFATYTRNEEDYKKDASLHAAFRGASYAAVAAQVFSPMFSHYPEHAKYFREAFKERVKETKAFAMPAVRFGAHCGTLMLGIVNTGKAPKFECFGLVPSLAARMCSTSAPFRCHITASMRDVIVGCDKQIAANGQRADDEKHRIFTFEEPRKTIVRGQGTITSFLINSTICAVPNAFLHKMGIKHSIASVRFDDTKLKPGERKRSTASSSTRSSSQASSNEHAKI